MTLDEAIIHAKEVMVENLEKTKGKNASDPIAINCFECAEEHRQLAEWLKELKQLREQTRWIPVSERLPENNVEVLVTTEWDCITIGEMFSNNDWFIHEGTTNTDIDDIKAWMPLPLPWKVEPQESEVNK